MRERINSNNNLENQKNGIQHEKESIDNGCRLFDDDGCEGAGRAL